MGFRGLTGLGSYQLLQSFFTRIVAELTNRHELAFLPNPRKAHMALCSSRDAHLRATPASHTRPHILFKQNISDTFCGFLSLHGTNGLSVELVGNRQLR